MNCNQQDGMSPLFSLLLYFEVGREMDKRLLTNQIGLRSTAGCRANKSFSKSVNRLADWIVDWFPIADSWDLETLCGRLFVVSFQEGWNMMKSFPLFASIPGNEQYISFICVGSCVVFFFGLFWRKAKRSRILMSTIAKTTPTRSGCLGVLPLRRPKVSSKASQSPQSLIIAIAERLGNSFNNGHIYDANKPSNTNFSYSFLFAISKTQDIDSARKRISGRGWTNIPFVASVTNISGVMNGANSRIMDRLFMDYDHSYDVVGMSVSGSSLFYFTD